MITPKMVLISTAQKATDKVSWNAKITSGWRSASITGARPCEKVALATSATGQITRKNRYATTTIRSTQRNGDRLRTVTTFPGSRPTPSGVGLGGSTCQPRRATLREITSSSTMTTSATTSRMVATAAAWVSSSPST